MNVTRDDCSTVTTNVIRNNQREFQLASVHIRRISMRLGSAFFHASTSKANPRIRQTMLESYRWFGGLTLDRSS